jgi:hypothetical protein
MLKLLFVAPLAAALATCGTEKAPRTIIICPDIKPYSATEQQAALKELDKLERNYPVSASLLGDYLASRDAARACLAKKKAIKL